MHNTIHRYPGKDTQPDNTVNFRRLVETGNDVSWVCQLDMTLVYISPQLWTLFGYAPEEWVGRSWMPLIHPEDVSRIEAILQSVIKTDKDLTGIEFRHAHKDASWRWVSLNVGLIQDSSGNTIGLQGVVRDIDSRKATQAKLQEQEQFLQSVYEAVEHSITVVDVLEDGEFRFAGWNPSTEKSTGILSEAIVGKTPEALMGEPHGKIVRRDYERCLEAGTSITYEEYLPFEEQDFWWLTTLNPIKDDRGKICRIVVTSFDITDRKQVEAELKQKEAQYRSIFETINDGISINELTTGKAVAVNPAFARMHGYTVEEFMQLSPTDYVHSDFLPLFSECFETVRAGNRFTCEATDLHREGGYINVEITTVPFLYNNQPHSLTIKRDITDRKQVEAELKQKEAQYRSIFETLNDGILITDLETGQTIEANPAAHRIYGYTYEEFMQLEPSKFIHPDYLENFSNVLARIQAGDRVFSEVLNLHKDGSYIDIEAIGVPFLYNGKPHALSVFRDVSDRVRAANERKAAEAALRQAESHYRSIFEAINDGINIIELETGNVVAVNPAFCQMHGYTAEEFLHLNPSQYVHADSFSKFSRFVATIQAGQRFFCEAIDLHKDGTLIDIEVTAVPFLYNNRQCGLSIVRDIRDRKAAEAAIKEANALLTSVLEATPGFLFVKDLQGRYLTLNSNVVQLLGKPMAEIIGKTDAELLPPEAALTLMRRDREILETEMTQQVEEVVRINGTDCTHLTTKTPLYNAQGDLIGLIGIALDISDRKAAEQAQARLTAILEATSDVVGIADMGGRMLYLNAAGHRLLEIPVEEDLTGLPIDSLHTSVNKQTLAAQAIPIALQHGLWQGESIIATRSGREIPVSQVIIAHKSAEGTPGYFSTIIRDITKQKQAEIASERRAQQENLLNQITSQIRRSLDFDTILTTTVEEVRKFMQIDSCSFAWYCPDAGEPYWEAVKQSNAKAMPNILGRYPVGVMGFLAEELVALNNICIEDVNQPEYETIQLLFAQLGWCALLSLPMQIPSGLIGVLGCHHQTERIWTEEEVKLLQAVMEQLEIALNQADLYMQSQTKAQELEQALQELQRTQLQMIQTEKMSSLGQLVAGVAHEINNPVNFIYGNLTPASQYIEDILTLINLYQVQYPNPSPIIQDKIQEIDLEFVEADLPRLFASMKMGADRIRQIVYSLRTFSRLDEAACKEVDIHEGIDSTLVILENRLKAKGDQPTVEVIRQYGDLPLVDCYAGQLNQVFMNILANALDALEQHNQHRSPEEIKAVPSRIEICTQALNGDRVQIRIADNGIGIPEGVRQRIFDPFFTTKPVGKGTGMGMSISYQIITENHGGTLQCFSTPGQGTEFVIEIPLKQQVS